MKLLINSKEMAEIFNFFQLTIRVSDVNDNAPKFELPDYQAHNVDEDISLGTSILKVKATDADSGANAEIEYLVSDDHFSVDSSGIIVNNKQLDADNNNAYYEFVVTARDKGKTNGVSFVISNLSCLSVTLRSIRKLSRAMIKRGSIFQGSRRKRGRRRCAYTRRTRTTRSQSSPSRCTPRTWTRTRGRTRS